MDVPQHWKIIKLRELVSNPKNDIVDGPFGSNLKASEYVGSGIPIIRLQNIDRNKFIDKNIQYITEEKAQELKRHNFVSGDIVITKLGNPLGKACIIPNNFPNGIVVADVVRARVTENLVNKNYLTYAINSQQVVEQLEPLIKGTTRPRVNLSHLRDIKIPLAPRQEQDLLVAKIEELFSQLDAGVAGLKRAQEELQRYRASVLKAAFEGRLVPQDPNDEPAEEMLEEFLGRNISAIMQPPEVGVITKVPKGWSLGKLEKLIYFAGRIGWRGLKADEYVDDGPLFLSVYNLNKGDLVDFTDVKHISQERYDESPEIMLQENDILLTKDGAGIGKIGIVKNLSKKATVNSSLLVIRASKIFIPEFLFYQLMGPQMQEIVSKRITGSATPHLFQRDIKNFLLLIPPVNEQKRIVNEIDKHFSIISVLEKTLGNEIRLANKLRPSILSNAFEGKLLMHENHRK
jgi:type I restriction enzyme, S subunit